MHKENLDKIKEILKIDITKTDNEIQERFPDVSRNDIRNIRKEILKW